MEIKEPQESCFHRTMTEISFWILEKKKTILYFFLFLIASILLSSRYLPFFHKDEAMLSSERAYQKWLENSRDENSWKHLHEALQKNRFIKERYASDIAQRWIGRNDLARARPYMKLGEDLDYYSTFSQTSCRIAEGNIQRALEEAAALKKQMMEDPLFSKKSLLYGHNLARILFLARELKNSPMIEAVQGELELYLKNNQSSLLSVKKEETMKNVRKNKEIALADFLSEQRATAP